MTHPSKERKRASSRGVIKEGGVSQKKIHEGSKGASFELRPKKRDQLSCREGEESLYFRKKACRREDSSSVTEKQGGQHFDFANSEFLKMRDEWGKSASTGNTPDFVHSP